MKNLSNGAQSTQGANAVILGSKIAKGEEKKAPAVLIFAEKEKKVEQLKEATPVKIEQTNKEPKRLTMEELTDRVDKLHLLRLKHQEIKDKRKQLECFSISHDKNNAQMTLVDTNGLSISTSNPQSIGKLIIDWTAELNTCLGKVEEDIRKIIETC